MDLVAFAIVAAVTLFSAIMCVTRRNPVYSAVWLLVCFLSFAVHYAALAAPFLAAIHVLVYTGAILVLFLFVIMLLNLREHEYAQEYGTGVQLGVGALSTGLFATLAWAFLSDPSLQAVPVVGENFGTVESVGMVLFRQYGLPFELVSLLIIVAMFGSLILAKRQLWNVAPPAPPTEDREPPVRA